MAKHSLNQLDWEELTPARVVEQLRSVEQDIRTDAANAARGMRGNRRGPGPGQRNRHNADKSNIECFGCKKMGHYKNEYPEADQEEDEDAEAKKETSRPKYDRNAFSRSQGRPPVKPKEKVALAAAESISEGSGSEEETPTKERV